MNCSLIVKASLDIEASINSMDSFFPSLWTQAYREQRGQLLQRQRTFGHSQFLDRQARGPERASSSHPAPQPSLQLRTIPGKHTGDRFPASSQQRVKAPCSQTPCGEEDAWGHRPTAVCAAAEAYQAEDEECCCKILFLLIFFIFTFLKCD